MNLYRLNPIPVVVAEDLERAVDRYEAQMEDEDIQESNFTLIVPSSDHSKIFKLALTLTRDEQYNYEEVKELVNAYAKKLGYELTEQELWRGVLLWAERLSEFQDDEIEEWLK